MDCITEIQIGAEYRCVANLNLYGSEACQGLVTQARAGRQLRLIHKPESPLAKAIQVCLCEDDYAGWLPAASVAALALAPQPYQPPTPTAQNIAAVLPAVMRFAYNATIPPNTYLWGGTVGPDFDCSGLVQTAFASAGIMLPRDSYQQQDFTEPVAGGALQPGDLLFFGAGDRTTHVALYVGQGNYLHSSGRDHGRNGVGIDSIVNLQDPISYFYYRQLRGAGRVTRSYQPLGQPMPCR